MEIKFKKIEIFDIEKPNLLNQIYLVTSDYNHVPFDKVKNVSSFAVVFQKSCHQNYTFIGSYNGLYNIFTAFVQPINMKDGDTLNMDFILK